MIPAPAPQVRYQARSFVSPQIAAGSGLPHAQCSARSGEGGILTRRWPGLTARPLSLARSGLSGVSSRLTPRGHGRVLGPAPPPGGQRQAAKAKASSESAIIHAQARRRGRTSHQSAGRAGEPRPARRRPSLLLPFFPIFELLRKAYEHHRLRLRQRTDFGKVHKWRMA